jgi:transposase-like protein
MRQVALDFGISAATLYQWLQKAEIKEGLREVFVSPAQLAENRELRRRKRVLEQEVEIRRRATAYFAKDHSPQKKLIYPLVRELAADGIAIRLICRVLKFSAQGYYRWLKRLLSARDYENAYLTNALVDAHRSDPTFGYRFLADELAGQGHLVGERRVWRLCSQALIWSSFARKSRSSKRPRAAVHDDLVLRNASANRANQLWFTDITEHPTKN